MPTVHQQIMSANQAICYNIEILGSQRGLLSQNILAQLRNLVEGIAVFFHTNSQETIFQYSLIGGALEFTRSRGKLNTINKFHNLLKKSVSHYTLDGDNSERLMLKYYEYLLRIRNLFRETGIEILENLEAFPIDLDPSMREYHEKIAAIITSTHSTHSGNISPQRYYIHKTRPFFCRGRIFYEVTF